MRFKIIWILIWILVLSGLLHTYVYFYPLKLADQSIKSYTMDDFIPKKIIPVNFLNNVPSFISDSASQLRATLMKDSALLPLSIQHPTPFENVLFSFYKALSEKKNQNIRVLHFGDSQIEGDRVTGSIRQHLQEKLGGCGPGFFPLFENNLGKNYLHSTPANWTKHQSFGVKKIAPSNGFLGYFFTLSDAKIKGDYQFSLLGRNTQNLQHFEKISVLGKTKKTQNLSISLNDSILLTTNTVQGHHFLSSASINGKAKQQYHLQFEADSTFGVYGIALDCNSGVGVDNIPLRGLSGLHFKPFHQQELKEQLKELNVHLVIYQFGVNVVPYQNQNYQFYEKMILADLKLIKRLLPEAAILVVSVSDMSWKNGGMMESYPNIDKIVRAQKNAAFKANCAFWNLYDAMGGKDAMVNWVNQDPALAKKDFTHFTIKGADLVGTKIAQALLMDYENFKSLYIED